MANYKIISKDDKKILVDFHGGTSLDLAATDAIALAKIYDASVGFNFNGVNLLVTKDMTPELVDQMFDDVVGENYITHQETNEGKKDKKEQAIELESNSTKVHQMLDNFDVASQTPDKLIKWLGEFSVTQDFSGIDWDREGLISKLEGLGYRDNECIGDPNVEHDKVIYTKWFVGKCINGLKNGHMNPIAKRFADDYCSRFCSDLTTPSLG